MLPSRSTTVRYVVSPALGISPAAALQLAFSWSINSARFAAHSFESNFCTGNFCPCGSPMYFFLSRLQPSFRHASFPPPIFFVQSLLCSTHPVRVPQFAAATTPNLHSGKCRQSSAHDRQAYIICWPLHSNAACPPAPPNTPRSSPAPGNHSSLWQSRRSNLLTASSVQICPPASASHPPLRAP